MQRNPCFQPGQWRAETEVDAVAEGQMGIRTAGHVEDVRSGEAGGITVGGTQVHHQQGVGRDLMAAEHHRPGGAPSQLGEGRQPAQYLLDGGRQPAGVPAQRGEGSGMPVEGDHGVAEQRGGGDVPGDQQQGDESDDLLVRQARSVHLGGEESAGEVVPGVGAAAPDVVQHVAVHLAHGRGDGLQGPFQVGHVEAVAELVTVEEGAGPFLEQSVVVGGDAEEFGDHDDRQGVGEGVDQVEPVAVGDAVEEARAHGLDARFEPVDRSGGEGLADQGAELAVFRRIHADEVALPKGFEVLLGGGDRREVGGVRRRVGEYGGHPLVVHDTPLVLRFVVGHGARLA